MKTAFRVVLVLTLLPVLLGLTGMFLSWYFDCSGMDHIEYCATNATNRQITVTLVTFVWISVFVVPVGLIVLAVLGLVRLFLKWRKGRQGAA